MHNIHTIHSIQRASSAGDNAQLATVENPVMQWGAIIDKYLANIDVKPATRETYRKALKQFGVWIADRNGNRPPERADIVAYKNYLAANFSASTVSAYLTAVRGLFAWLEAEKVFPNVAAGVKGAKSAKGFKRDTLTTGQVRRMLDTVDGDNLETMRDFALINLLLRTGLRTIEAERANIEDIRQEGGQALLYVQGKGRDSKDAFVVLTDATLAPTQAYLAARKETDGRAPLFAAHGNRNAGGRLTTRSIRRIVKGSMRAAGIDSERLTAHSLRHTAITFALLGGAGLQEAQAMARHSNINTTLIYAHNINRIASAPERMIDQYLENNF